MAILRDAIGTEIDLAVDAHGPSWMTTSDAIFVGRELEAFDYYF